MERHSETSLTSEPRRGWTKLLDLLHQLLKCPENNRINMVLEAGDWTRPPKRS